MFKLVIQDDEGKTTVVPLIRDEITIGRKEGNTIRLTERNVSRRHARIVRVNGAVAIEDLGSYNGVRVNGTRIAQKTSLAVSDRVQIGDYLIELKVEGVEANADVGKTQQVERVDVDELDSQLTKPMQALQLPEHLAAELANKAKPAAGADASANKEAIARAVTAQPVAPVIATALTPAMATAPAARSTVLPVPRLVVLSTNFAGKEWALHNADTIIGRTDENDVVINHRSISRNHAKVSRDAATGKFFIHDLQSSNGVRVNGEEYGKVELRRGDIVDLGHVRIRFVEAGEDFLFGRDAVAADVPVAGRNRSMIMALIAIVVVGGAAGVVVAVRGSKKPVEPPPASTVTGTAIQPSPVPDQPAPPVVAANPLATKLGECKVLIDSESWTSLQDCAKAALTIDGTSDDARKLASMAKRELGNQLQFGKVQDGSHAKNYSSVIDALAKIDGDSIYHGRAQDIHDKLKADYTTDVLSKAKAFAKNTKCQNIATLAEQAQKLWPDVADSVRGTQCDSNTVAAVPAPAGDKQKAADKPKVLPTDKVKPPVDKPKVVDPTTCDAPARVSEAQTEGMAGNYKKMLSKAEEALQCDHGNRRAKQFALIAACHLHNKEKINAYFKQMTNADTLVQDCMGDIDR